MARSRRDAPLAKAGPMMHTRSVERRALILIHEEMEGAGLLGSALRTAGFELVQRFRRLEPGDYSAPLWVVMGGPMAVYEANHHPFLSAEIGALQERLAGGRPTLGICLGAQLLAAAAGAVVGPGQLGLELGVLPVSLSEAAASDPVFGDLPPNPAFVHWHQDAFGPVPGATHLASTARYREQAFRLGSSYGLQFHPELDAATFEEWLRASPADVERSGRSLQSILDADLPKLRTVQPVGERLLDRLARHFADRCLSLERRPS